MITWNPHAAPKTDAKPDIELRHPVTVFDELNELLLRQLNERAHHSFPDQADVSGADSVKAEYRDGLLRLASAMVNAAATQKAP